MTYWCSDHQQFERDSPHTPDTTYNELRAEVERLRILLRDYRQKHPCDHDVMCWADEIAAKALARYKGT